MNLIGRLAGSPRARNRKVYTREPFGGCLLRSSFPVGGLRETRPATVFRGETLKRESARSRGFRVGGNENASFWYSMKLRGSFVSGRIASLVNTQHRDKSGPS